jgi:hypothetical protein
MLNAERPMFNGGIPSEARNLATAESIRHHLGDVMFISEILRFTQDDTRRRACACQLTFGTKTPSMASPFPLLYLRGNIGV